MLNSARWWGRQRVLTTAIAIGCSLSVATAGVNLFADNFDRADATDVDASADGMSGVLVGTALNPPGGVWLEPTDDGTGVATKSAIVDGALNLANGNSTSHIVLDYNLAAEFATYHGIRISFDALDIAASDSPLHRYIGVGIGGSVAELDVNDDRHPSRAADLFVAVTLSGELRVNDELPALRASTGDVSPSYAVDLDPDTSNILIPGTVHIDLTFPDTQAGTVVTYDVSFDDGSGEVDVLPGTRTFVWTGTDEVAIALDGRAPAAGILMDNFSITTSKPVRQALVESNDNALMLYSIEDGVWTAEGTFISGSYFGQTFNSLAFAQDPNTGDIIAFENRSEASGNNRVIRFDKSGWPIEIIGQQGADFSGAPFFGTMAPNGDLLFTTQFGAATPAKVVKYEAATQTWIDPFIPNNYTVGDTLSHLRGVTATPDGRLFISDRDDAVNSVLEFDLATGAFIGTVYSDNRAQAIEYDAVGDRLLLSVDAAQDDVILEFPNQGDPSATSFDFGSPNVLFDSPDTVAMGIHSFVSDGENLYVARFQRDDIATLADTTSMTTLANVANPSYLHAVDVTTAGRYDLNLDDAIDVDDVLLAMLNVGGPDVSLVPVAGDPIEFDKLDIDDDDDVDIHDFVGMSAAFNAENEAPFQATGPNVVLILLDDLGYSDLGCYGSEIHTPTIDSLAANGLRFRNFYNAARCAPTRCAILTGQYTQRVATNPGASLPPLRTDNNITIAEVLGAAGYRTYMAGKWHLGSGSRSPLSRGFEQVFGFGSDVSGSNVTTFWNQNLYNFISSNGEIAPIDFSGQQFYQTDAIGDYSVKFIEHHNSKQDGKPFFLYMAFNAVHWPIESYADMADNYTDVGDDDPSDTDYWHYEDGYEVTRLARYNRQLLIGAVDSRYALTPRGVHPVHWDQPNVPAIQIPEWNTHSQDRKNDLARRMSVYAAMLERLDQNVKKVVDKLTETGQLDDTLILICADNGGNYEHSIYGTDSPRTNYSDLRNMGQPGDYQIFGRTEIGGAWANVCNTPYYLYKHFAHEGGMGSPGIIYWPARMNSEVKGTWTDTRGHIIDFLPTIIDASGAPYPDFFDGHTVNPPDGVSLLPLVDGDDLAPRDIYLEHERNRAMFRGNYKFVTKNFDWPDGAWPADELELYDMSVDASETNNLATTEPVTLQEMIDAWNAWAQEVGVPSARWVP